MHKPHMHHRTTRPAGAKAGGIVLGPFDRDFAIEPPGLPGQKREGEARLASAQRGLPMKRSEFIEQAKEIIEQVEMSAQGIANWLDETTPDEAAKDIAALIPPYVWED
jgi:hypothetical protein